jgi:hypothetical protein
MKSKFKDINFSSFSEGNHENDCLIKYMFKLFQFIILSFFLLGMSPPAHTQEMQLEVVLKYNGLKLDLTGGKGYQLDSSSLRIHELKFYLSDFRFYKNGELVINEKTSFHLVDLLDDQSKLIKVPNPKSLPFDEIRFGFGLDSLTNVSGALGGDLDPTKGMYWSWQSGYIHFKIEGTNADCPNRNHEFTYHLGGYSSPNACYVQLQFPLSSQNDIKLIFDAAVFLNEVDMKQVNQIMSPSPTAADLFQLASKAFSISE